MHQGLPRLGIAVALMSAPIAHAAGPAEPPRPAGSPPPSASVSPPAPAPEPDPVTTIHVVRPREADPRLMEALETARVQLGAQGLDLGIVETSRGQSAAAAARALVERGATRGVFWLDQRDAHELRVFLLDDEGSAYVRRIPVEPGGAEASREAVWLIVESGSLALAAGQQVAMEKARAEELEPEPEPELEPAPAPAPKPVVTPEPELEPAPPRSRGWVGLSYLGAGLAGAVPWSSGVAVDGGVDLGPRWRLSAGYGLLLPWRAGDPVVTWRHRGELRGGPRVALGSRAEFHALVGGGLEVLRWRSPSEADDGWRPTGFASLDVGLSVRLAGPLWLRVEPGAEVLLGRADFVECAAGASDCEGASRRVALRPWPARPRARAGLAVAF